MSKSLAYTIATDHGFAHDIAMAFAEVAARCDWDEETCALDLEEREGFWSCYWDL